MSEPTSLTDTRSDLDDAVIAQAEESFSSDWSAAIDLLRTANASSRSDRLELALTDLRCRAGLRLAQASVPGPRPEPAAAPPVGPSGLPEVTPPDLTAAVLRGAIDEHGCLLVRGAVDEQRGRALAESIDRAFGARADAAAGDASAEPAWFSPRRREPRVDPLDRTFATQTSGLLLCDTPRMMYEVLELYTDLGLAAVAAEFLGGRPVLSANKCTVRRISLDTTGGWHQDGRFLGDGLRALNIWLALTPCGTDAPGLDVVPRRLDAFVDAGTSGAYFDWAVSDAMAADAAGAAGIVRPELGVGDMLLFDEMMLHKTAMTPTMTKERHAIETWCFSGVAYPKGHLAIAW